MLGKEFKQLINEYKNASSSEDKLIKLKLEEIEKLCFECGREEYVFAKEIIIQFSRIVSLIKEQQKEKAFEKGAFNYTGFNGNRRFQSGYELLGAFYDKFKKQEEISYFEIESFPFASEEEKKRRTSSTLLDYVARINTFAKRYLYEIFSLNEIDSSNTPDDIIFIYENLEVILAKFSTKDEKGVSVKQRVNIRSALRKLNEFKCMQQ